MSEPIGIGVVGAGMIAQRGILPHLSQDDVQDRLRLVAVCDPAPGRADASAERFGSPRRTTSFEDLLADPAVDAVSIASPIGLHFEQAKAALDAGKHVHVNKTMSTTTAEADELIALANDRSLVARRFSGRGASTAADRDPTPDRARVRSGSSAGGSVGVPWATTTRQMRKRSEPRCRAACRPIPAGISAEPGADRCTTSRCTPSIS